MKRLNRNRSLVGLTLVEVLVAMAIFATTIGSSIVALTSMNNAAQRSRLKTGAQSVAQNHIDDAMNRDWNALVVSAQALPFPLEPGTYWVGPNTADTDNDGLIAYYDADESGAPFSYSTIAPAAPNVPIYEENPLSNTGVTIRGTVRVTTTNITPVGANFPLHRIAVRVAYEHRGQPQLVELITMRTSN